MSFPSATSKLWIKLWLYIWWCDVSLLLFIGCFLVQPVSNSDLQISEVMFLNPKFTTFSGKINEPRHDKTNKVRVRPAKTQISLGIRPVWSESSLSAWRKLGSLATQWAHSEDWSDWADAQADLTSLGAHAILLVLSWGGSYGLMVTGHIHWIMTGLFLVFYGYVTIIFVFVLFFCLFVLGFLRRSNSISVI